MTTLSQYYESVYRPWKHDKAKPATISQHRWIITSLSNFAEHDVTIEEITPQFLRAWSIWAQANGFTIPSCELYCTLTRSIVRDADPSSWPLPGNREALWKDASEGTLLAFVRNVYALERVIEHTTVLQYEYCIYAFGEFLLRAPVADDLTSENLNRFLISYAKDHKPETVRGKRRGLLTIWRAMYEAELIDNFPRRVRKLKPQHRVIVAWTPADVELLFKTAGELKGICLRFLLPKRIYWQLLIILAYETGMRLGDCRGLELRQIPTDGIFTKIQHKTGHVITCELSPLAMSLVQQAVALGVPSLVGIIDKRQVLREFQRLRDRASLQGTFRFIRRAGATAVEKLQPGAATKFLGHKTPGLAMQHYVDQSQLMQQRPKPPAIGGKGGAQ